MVRTANRLPGFRVDIRTFKVVITVLVGLAAIVGTWAPLQAEPLTVGAPPSLRAAFSDILPLFVQEYGAEVHVDYTPSKTLLHQIEKGAPVDVFLSAGVEEVEYLHKKGLTLNGRPRVLRADVPCPCDVGGFSGHNGLLSRCDAESNHPHCPWRS